MAAPRRDDICNCSNAVVLWRGWILSMRPRNRRRVITQGRGYFRAFLCAELSSPAIDRAPQLINCSRTTIAVPALLPVVRLELAIRERYFNGLESRQAQSITTSD
jgi:hypothetical protein